MAKTQKDIEKYLNDLYDTIISNGKTHDEALENVSLICKALTNKMINSSSEIVLASSSSNYNGFISQVIANPMFRELNISSTFLDIRDYRDALLKILNRWQKKAEKDIIPTNASAKEIITNFANVILENFSEKIVIDPAIGTASLLLDIKNAKIIGRDINERLCTFAENILLLSKFKEPQIEKYNTLLSQNRKDINDADVDHFWNNKGLFIFDPPIGIKMQKSSLLKSHTTEILNNSTENYVLSEVNFLLNFLAFAPNGSYCLCKMPISFLNSRQRDLDILREYIIKNNLLAVIKDADNFITLFLQKKDESLQDYPLYAINYDSDLSEDFIKNIISKQDIDITSKQNIKKLTRSEILDELAGNVIPMPTLRFNVKKYEKPLFYFNKILDFEKNISSSITRIKTSLVENEFIYLTEEENQQYISCISGKEDIEQIAPTVIKDSNNNSDNGIDENKEENQSENSDFNTQSNALWYKLLTQDDDKDLYKIFNSNALQIKDYAIRWISPNFVKTGFNYLGLLYSQKLLKFDEDKILLTRSRNMLFDLDNSNFEDRVLPENYKSCDNRIKFALNIISTEQKKLYYNLCKYWFNYQENLNKDLFGAYSYAYITRTLKLFETLGLVTCLDNEQNYTNYYDMFRPYHPLIDDFKTEDE